ncbi:MAG TPA: CBS domain-containing protein [Fimbriimonadaceae bacterium]|nr:CBS domain-containing protein [Fimbriimonadaceae bacterium]
MQRPDPLAQPVGTLLRPTEILHANDSLALAAANLRESPFGALPVTDGSRMLGVVTERGLAEAILQDLPSHTALSQIVEEGEEFIVAYSSGAEALRQFA